MGNSYSIYISEYVYDPFEYNKSYQIDNIKNISYKSILLDYSYLYNKEDRIIYNINNKGFSVVCAIATSLNYYSNNKYYSPGFIQYCVQLELQSDNIYRGVSVIDALNIIQKYGVCLESDYSFTNILNNESPSTNNFKLAKNNNINYYSIKQINTQMIHVLSSKNIFIIGITLYNNFDYDTYNKDYNVDKNIINYQQIIQIPSEDDIIIGTKCFLVIGHNDIEEYFIILDCSLNIEYKISYDYLEDTKFSNDLFVIKPMD